MGAFQEKLKRAREEKLNALPQDGRDGIDGKDGCTPVKGVDYFDGEQGPPGPQGEQGIDGKDGRDGIDADEEKIIKKLSGKIPRIKESVETDPMEIIDLIMKLPEDKFKIKSSQVSGLGQTISAFHSQLSRGYFHGGGISDITGLIAAGTNITISGLGTKTSPYVINATSSGSVQSVTGTSPIIVNNTNPATPIITIQQANGLQSGYLSATDWNTFNNKQAVGNYITALTGDVTAAGPGSAAATVQSFTVANEATDTTCFPLFVTAATGSLGPKTNTSLTFNSLTGAYTSLLSNNDIEFRNADLTSRNADVTGSLLFKAYGNVGLTSWGGSKISSIYNGNGSGAHDLVLYTTEEVNPLTFREVMRLRDMRSAGVDYPLVGIGISTPTAGIHIRAGTTLASSAPLKFTSGSLMTAPEVGSIEFLTDAFYGTITTGTARKQFAFTSDLTGFVTSVSGTTNRITSTGGTTPVIDISASYVGQSSITTVGTLSAGAVPTTLLTGTLQAAQFPALTGDVTTVAGALAATLATVNSNVGTFGSATQSVSITVNSKGLVTAISNVTVTPAVGSITGLGTGIATWLATPSSANLLAAQTDKTGTGLLVFGTSPTLTTAALGSSTATTQTPADNSTKVATTAYVDNAVLGQNFKEACKVATTANLVGIYLNGTAGVGATFTYTATGTDVIDGVTLALGDRVLVKNQSTDFQNGIYTVTTAGALGVAGILTRATDSDQTTDWKTGDSVFITSGTTLSTTTWAYTGIDNPTMGTTSLTFAQTAGQGSFTAGNGISITGVSIAIDTSVTVDKTTAQTLTNKTLTTPVINGLPTGTGVATANTASTLVARDGSGNFSAGTITATLTGNASTATALQNARTIGGVSFNGTANITVASATGGFTVSGGNLVLDTINISTDTTTGTKIGTATTQKIGFFNSSPIVKPTGDVATALSNLGLVASPTIIATTNANLTGPITSVGNATAIASQTGTGTKFVVDTSPTIITPTFTTNFTSPIWKPAADSTTAIQINKADGTTNVVNIDTTNGYVGIGITSPTSFLHISGTAATTITPAALFDVYTGGSATNYNAAPFLSRIARGTAGSPSAVKTDDVIGGLSSRAYLATAFSGGLAQVIFRMAQDATDSAAGTYIDVRTTANGATSTSLALRATSAQNIKIAGTAVRATTEGTNHLDIFDGTAPAGTLANGISLYSTAGELRVMDGAGNATLLSPHEDDTNYWIYDSVDSVAGKRLKIDTELLMRKVNNLIGGGYIHEWDNDTELTQPPAINLEEEINILKEKNQELEVRISVLEGSINNQ